MSGWWGAVGLGGRPVATDEVRQLAAPGESPAVLRAGRSALFGHPPGLSSAADGPLAVVADARLDNAAELADRLLPAAEEPTAAELVLAAYRRWGGEWAGRLLGDFAVVLWDGPRGRLLCARDPFGCRPLLWARAGDLLLVAGDAAALLRHPALARGLGEVAVADHLAGMVEDPARTLVDGVRRVPPGCTLSVTADGLRLRPFWQPEATGRCRFRRPQEYAEAFAETFGRAVADRLPAAGRRVAVAMSGGIDSCAVAAVAAGERRRAAASPPLAASFVFERLTACDESRYIRAVAEHVGMEVAAVTADRYPVLGEPALWRPAADSAFASWEEAAHQLGARLRQRGVTVLLTGHGGDEVAGGSALSWTDRMRRGDPRPLIEVARRARRGGGPLLSHLYTYLAAPLLPPAADHRLRRLAGRPPAPAVPDWLDPGLAQRSDLALRAEARAAPRRFADAARQRVYEVALGPRGYGRQLAWWDRLGRRYGFVARHPFLDRRLVELVLSFPPPVVFGADLSKPLLRRATAGLLPDRVRLRRGKTDLSGYLDDSLRGPSAATVERLLAAPWAAGLGLVDGERLRAAWRRYRAAGGRGERSLWFAVTLELWLREHATALGLAPGEVRGRGATAA